LRLFLLLNACAIIVWFTKDWKNVPFAHLQALPTDAKPLTTWKNQESALAAVAVSLRRMIEELPLLAASVPSVALPSIWNVPYLRNPHFTGRDELLDQLHQQLSPQVQDDPTATRQVALTQPQAIKGLGGIGKTQIAIEYAYRSREQGDYKHTFWVNAASEEALLTSFVTLAQLLPAFPAKSEPDQQKLVAAIKRWLEQCQQRWLLIFDNADDISLLREYLPQRGNGSILLTTRADAVGSLAASIEVETMGFIEGTHLLLRRAQRFANTSDEEINQAGNIVVALDHFPLALDQAGAYIEETQCSFVEYLNIYQNHREALLAWRGAQATGYPNSVATTWSLSFQHVEQASPAAADLLRLCAFLSPDRIPEELIKNGAAYWPSLLQQAAAGPFTFNQMIAELLKFSLVKGLVDDQLLSIHRLVQVVQIDMMEPEVQRQWAQRVIRAVNEVFPRTSEDVATWPQCLRYLEQAQACDALIRQYLLTLTEASDLLHRTGDYLRSHASYTLAESLYQRALGIREQQVATSLHGLGILYFHQGKYTEAESLFQRALHIREQQLGPESPEVTSSLNGLALLYFKQGKYTEAGPLFQRALHIREQQLGPEHPDVASALSNLANFYREQGKYEEMEPLFQRVLRIREQQLGSEHPEVASALNGLALLYWQQGKYPEAEPLFQRALRIREQQLGSEHPLVAESLNNLAIINAVQSKYTEAKPLFQRSLAIREKQLGTEHPDVATSLNNLGELYYEQGRYEEAEPLLQRALHIREQQLRPEHPRVAESLNNLGGLYGKQDKYAEAEYLYQRSRHIQEQQLGPEHPDVAHSLSNLANLYQDQGKYAEAEPLYQHALRIREQALGPQHSETAETMHDLARLQEAQGNSEKARTWYTQALAVRVQALGAHHPKTTETRKRIIALLQALRLHDEAALLEEAKPEQEKNEEELKAHPEG
jgi:tetratricopeptide (TPR) repeat protein